MIGLGTIINSAAIVAGGLIGHVTGKLFRQDQQDAVNKACGISVLFIAIAGAMQGMLYIDNGAILSGKSMLVVLCLALGTIVGELIGIEKGFECFGMAEGEIRQQRRQAVCECVCDRFADRMHRRHGDRRLNTGRDFRGLFHARRQSGSGLYHHRGHDLFTRERLHVLGHSRFPF